MSDQHDIKIGTNVYIVVAAKLIVVAARVVEKMTRETAEGVRVSYILDFGIQGKERVPSDSIEGGLLVESIDAAYELLVADSRNKVRKLCDDAVLKAQERFGSPRITNFVESVEDVEV